MISQVTEELNCLHFATGLILFALGIALAGPSATTAITVSLPESKQGIASAVNDTARELGSALGIAVLGSVLNQQYREGMTRAAHDLPPAVAQQAQTSVAFTQSAAIEGLGSAGTRLVSAAEHAFVHGISGSLSLAAAIVAVTAVMVAALAPKRAASLTQVSVPEHAVLAAGDTQGATATHRPVVDAFH